MSGSVAFLLFPGPGALTSIAQLLLSPPPLPSPHKRFFFHTERFPRFRRTRLRLRSPYLITFLSDVTLSLSVQAFGFFWFARRRGEVSRPLPLPNLLSSVLTPFADFVRPSTISPRCGTRHPGSLGNGSYFSRCPRPTPSLLPMLAVGSCLGASFSSPSFQRVALVISSCIHLEVAPFVTAHPLESACCSCGFPENNLYMGSHGSGGLRIRSFRWVIFFFSFFLTVGRSTPYFDSSPLALKPHLRLSPATYGRSLSVLPQQCETSYIRLIDSHIFLPWFLV